MLWEIDVIALICQKCIKADLAKIKGYHLCQVKGRPIVRVIWYLNPSHFLYLMRLCHPCSDSRQGYGPVWSSPIIVQILFLLPVWDSQYCAIDTCS